MGAFVHISFALVGIIEQLLLLRLVIFVLLLLLFGDLVHLFLNLALDSLVVHGGAVLVQVQVQPVDVHGGLV